MQFLKKDDSIFDILCRALTVAFLPLWHLAYFTTVQPIFEKQQALDSAVNENEKLRQERSIVLEEVAEAKVHCRMHEQQKRRSTASGFLKREVVEIQQTIKLLRKKLETNSAVEYQGIKYTKFMASKDDAGQMQ